jgi:hypothetical protein
MFCLLERQVGRLGFDYVTLLTSSSSFSSSIVRTSEMGEKVSDIKVTRIIQVATLSLKLLMTMSGKKTRW